MRKPENVLILVRVTAEAVGSLRIADPTVSERERSGMRGDVGAYKNYEEASSIGKASFLSHLAAADQAWG